MAAGTLRRNAPEVLGELREREGWLAREATKIERIYARSAARTIPTGLAQEAKAREAAMCRHTADVEQQRARDAVEVPGLSMASLVVLENVRAALDATDGHREGERHGAHQRRREEAVAGARTTGRADPRVAGELDQFMVAVGQRLGDEGMRTASRPGVEAGRKNIPGVGPDQRTRLDMLARSFKLGREGVEQSTSRANRLRREAHAAKRERTCQEERQRLGLTPEPPREQRKKGPGLSR